MAITKLNLCEIDPNRKSGRLILNFNMEGKMFMEVDGAISAAEAIYMLEYAKAAILEDEEDA